MEILQSRAKVDSGEDAHCGKHLLKVVHDAAQSCTKKAFRISPVKYSKPERSAVQDPQSKWSEHDFHRFGDKVMDVHDNAQHQPLKMIPRHLLCY